MLEAPTKFVIVFILISVILVLALVAFIVFILYSYQKKQNTYLIDTKALKAAHQNSLLQSQLEIQEQTLQNISREIHDNIGQKLTLIKLHLSTLNYTDINNMVTQIPYSIDLISETITDLSDVSRSMSSDVVLNNGLIKALEFEVGQLSKSSKYRARFSATGSPVFLDAHTELVLYRITQEALTNIIKHAEASEIDILLHYDNNLITISIKDNGKGFSIDEKHFGIGLSNMKRRANALKGSLVINSTAKTCTHIKINVPFYANTDPIQAYSG